MSLRTAIAAALEAALPASKYDVRDIEDLPDKPSRAIVTVALIDYQPAANYQGSMQANLRFFLISKQTDKAKAEDDLDNLLPDLIAALKTTGVVWRRATPQLVKEMFYAYEIPGDTIAQTIDET